MNPVLAGLGMLTAAVKLSGLYDKFRPLSRDPDDLELGQQFMTRVQRLGWDTEDLANVMGYYEERSCSDTMTEDERSLVFRQTRGCDSSVRREMLSVPDAIDEVRVVTRHRNFNPDSAERAWVGGCVTEMNSRLHWPPRANTQSDHKRDCKAHWRDMHYDWNEIVRMFIEYKKLEKRNCPLLISGLNPRRLR